MSLAKNRNTIISIFLGVITLLLFSCSTSPSETEAKKAIASQYRNLVKVVSFVETNAQQGELAGIKFYKMEYEAQIEYLENVVLNKFMGEVVEIRKGKKSPYDFMGREIRKGTKEKIKGLMTKCWK